MSRNYVRKLVKHLFRKQMIKCSEKVHRCIRVLFMKGPKLCKERTSRLLTLSDWQSLIPPLLPKFHFFYLSKFGIEFWKLVTELTTENWQLIFSTNQMHWFSLKLIVYILAAQSKSPKKPGNFKNVNKAKTHVFFKTFKKRPSTCQISRNCYVYKHLCNERKVW